MAAVIIGAVASFATLAAVWFPRESARHGRDSAVAGGRAAKAGQALGEYGRQAVEKAAEVAALSAQAREAARALLRETEASRLATIPAVRLDVAALVFPDRDVERSGGDAKPGSRS